ncbi:MAG TPA: hypothetical protein VHZ51_10315 [Ktedonobacteraceae bacterium]|jgi:hypothetical protein|nr:hypothetical protein [Ktedonobacteraceae bacterium]
MGEPLLCLVTIHGIGFEQPPLVGVPGYPDTPGYADKLHAHLGKYLDATWLCNDPQRPQARSPVYVQSAWPPNSQRHEEGLRRLGQWNDDHTSVSAGAAGQLCDGEGRIAHIALVYSQLEDRGPKLASALTAGVMTTFTLGHYTTLLHLLRTVLLNVKALWHHLIAPKAPTDAETSLNVRQDPGFQQKPLSGATNGLFSVVRQLEDDVAAYVYENGMRQRVQGFVYDALLRLAGRDDVAGIVINAHSNGTVVAFDVLRNLPPFAARKVKVFITAGSPLRKYVDFFSWGEYIGTLAGLEHWYNYLDPRDPVADPLVPDAGWRRGSPQTTALQTGLFEGLDPDTGQSYALPLADIRVDNLKNSLPGGLQAHNYWDNEIEFVQSLASLLQQSVVSWQAPARVRRDQKKL